MQPLISFSRLLNICILKTMSAVLVDGDLTESFIVTVDVVMSVSVYLDSRGDDVWQLCFCQTIAAGVLLAV